MTKQIKILYAVVILSAIVSCKQSQEKNGDDKLPIDVIAVGENKSWGYEIYVDNKLFIKQNHIPAISGNHQFENREQALIAANLVIAKMKEGKKPVVTEDELKHAGINILN